MTVVALETGLKFDEFSGRLGHPTSWEPFWLRVNGLTPDPSNRSSRSLETELRVFRMHDAPGGPAKEGLAEVVPKRTY